MQIALRGHSSVLRLQLAFPALASTDRVPAATLCVAEHDMVYARAILLYTRRPRRPASTTATVKLPAMHR